MNIKKMSKEELELLSYNDIAYHLLKVNKEVMTTAEIFKEIKGLLNLSDDEYINRIGDFYTTLTTDKRFYSVGKGVWDLKERNVVKVIIDDDDDELIEEDIEEDIDDNDDSVDLEIDSDDDVEDDDLDEFGISEEDVVEEDKYED